jgi:hypothetical protein
MSRLFGAALAGLLTVAFVGCGPAAVPAISFSPENSASQAMATYDANKDNKLDAAELKKCPALADGLLNEMDTNGDKCLDEGEIAARIKSYADSGTRLRDVAPLRLLRGGRPVVGATVTLEPEKFMAGSIKPATGVSGESGDVEVKTEGQLYPGAQIGFFQVIVSQKDPSGKELIPAKYNSATTVGVEIAPGNRFSLILDLNK